MTREELIKNLTKPLTAEEIEWVITNTSDNWTTIAPYTDARAIMNRLDTYVGPFNWRVSYREAQIGEIRGVIATLEIRDPLTQEWVAKEDGAPPMGRTEERTETAFKGGISAALKRAAAAWGVGRELYFYPRVMIRGKHRYIPYKVLNRLKGLPEAFAAGKPLPEVIYLEEDGTEAKRSVA